VTEPGPSRPFARVLLDVPAPALESPLHYAIPAALAASLAVGIRVSVPFGRRTVAGFVVGFDAHAPVADVLPIEGILDPEPFFDEDVWRLASWIADRYLATPLEAIKAAFPTAAMSSPRAVLRPAADAPADGGGDSGVAALLEALGGEERDAEEVAASLADRAAFRHALVAARAAGWVTVERAIRGPALRARVEPHVRLSGSADAAREAAAALARRAPKRAEILRRLADEGELPRSAVVDSASALRALVLAGLVVERNVERPRDPLVGIYREDAPPVPATPAQDDAFSTIAAALREVRHEVIVLRGVTGSGKTEVYLRLAAEALAHGRQALVLVPEIALTPQTVARFLSRFGDRIALLHSRLAPGERYDTWRRLRRAEPDVVVGPRSALFAPLPRLGLVVVDEEHEPSYKQEQSPRYHARDAAIERARARGAPVVLGSATPSLETLHRVRSGVWTGVTLPDRIGGRPLPPVRIVDMRDEPAGAVFSDALASALHRRFGDGDQALLFVNRRGYASFVLCRECGHVPRCPNCHVSMTLHAPTHTLRCHYCGRRTAAPSQCPRCGGVRIHPFGPGTQRVEQEVRALLPSARVARADRDTMGARGAHDRLIADLRERRVDVVVGTQMIGKGLDLPDVALVGVVASDVGLHFPDYRAAERTFQQLTQVAGRAGRGAAAGEVIFQTYHPLEPAIQAAAAHDVDGFAAAELATREALRYPPFARIANVIVSSLSARDAEAAATSFVEAVPRDVETLGPAPAPFAKLRGWHRWQVMIRAAAAEEIRRAARAAKSAWRKPPGVRLIVDVDPVEML
jgi:primosomal protein N' (replication factor Y)